MRFVVITLVVAVAITVVGRLFSDFDEPDDPNDVIRGIGLWIVAVLAATLEALLAARKSH